MRRFPYIIVDVFTDNPLQGNPLCVFTDATGLSDEEMQALAKGLIPGFDPTTLTGPNASNQVKTQLLAQLDGLVKQLRDPLELALAKGALSIINPDGGDRAAAAKCAVGRIVTALVAKTGSAAVKAVVSVVQGPLFTQFGITSQCQ